MVQAVNWLKAWDECWIEFDFVDGPDDTRDRFLGKID